MAQFSTDSAAASTGEGAPLPSLAACTALSINQVRSLSPLALAYVGDAVYELHVRRCLLMPPKQIRAYHQQVVDQVRAEQQAYYLGCLKPHLTDEELDVVRRGRNAAANRKTRASLQDYQQATALEALIGYLYLTAPHRLNEVLAHLPFTPELA